ncbi:MAG TPA: STAS domain-containing protein [Acidimicrobiia bacterium]|nr:STAS domain-containing protein [Acidimicrobiia bacterium]
MSDLELQRGAGGDDELLVAVRGEIDMASAPQLRELLESAIEGGVTRVVLDCRGLEFLDSSGIGVLVAARKRLGDAGELVIDSPPAHVRKVLDITGVGDHLTVR